MAQCANLLRDNRITLLKMYSNTVFFSGYIFLCLHKDYLLAKLYLKSMLLSFSYAPDLITVGWILNPLFKLTSLNLVRHLLNEGFVLDLVCTYTNGYARLFFSSIHTSGLIQIMFENYIVLQVTLIL